MLIGFNTQTLAWLLIGFVPFISASLWIGMQYYQLPHKEVIAHTVAILGAVCIYFLEGGNYQLLFFIGFYVFMSLFNQFHSEVYDDPEKRPLYLLDHLRKLQNKNL